MEFPYICSCGHENWVEMDRLERRPLDKLMQMKGYSCQKCGDWKPVFFETALLLEAMFKLSRAKKSSAFRYHFTKVLQKAIATYERGIAIYKEQNGESRHNHLAISG